MSLGEWTKTTPILDILLTARPKDKRCILFLIFILLESLFKNEKGFCFCLQLFRMTEKPNQILYIQYVILCYLENRDVPQKFSLFFFTYPN